jgi:hypothetical protein
MEAGQIVDGASVQGDIDEPGTGLSAPRPLPSSIVDQATHALVARAWNIELCGMLSTSAVRFRDRERPVVEPNNGLE